MPQTIKPEDVIDVLLDVKRTYAVCWCSSGEFTPRQWYADEKWHRLHVRGLHQVDHSHECLKAQALMAQALEAL